MKKVGILTQPLHDNYGGLLQAYALKEVLKSLGFEVVIINRRGKESSKFRRFLSKTKNMLLRKRVNSRDYLSDYDRNIVSAETLSFRKNYIEVESEPITDNISMANLKKDGFGAFVVGSDQCWRPRYSPQITNYFLDFAVGQPGVKRISYAASFGVSDWEYDETLTNRCRELIQKFDAVSVREDSGVKLVENYFKMPAVHVVDPTMLLKKADYIALTEREDIRKSSGDIKAYILDKTPAKAEVIKNVQKHLDLKLFEVLPARRFGFSEVEDIRDYAFPNPLQWIQGFNDAKFVLTDSFHGTVFAIIFNRPFLVIPNLSRGVARFESLLRMFGLEDRIIRDISGFDAEKMLKKEINWASVNRILDKERSKGIDFLETNLK